MKKHILLFLSIFSLVAFSGCDDRDEIRDDINALSARLDALQACLHVWMPCRWSLTS